jgi:hemerythrin superfamily protein
MAKELDALDLLRQDHERVEQMFRRFERARDEAGQLAPIEEACAALTEHADLEERCFYPMVLAMTGDERLMEEAQIEHASARQLIDELRTGKTQGARRLALFRVLMEYVRHHVREEESRIFPLVKKTGVDLAAFGEELAERKGEALGAGRKAGGKPVGSQGTLRRASREQEEMDESMPAEGRARAEQRSTGLRAAELRRPGKPQRLARGNGGDDGEEARRERGAEDNEAHQASGKQKLSGTTRRAKWISSPEEHEDRPGQSLATRSHEVIRHWAEERRAAPATTPGTDPQRPRVLRFNFPGFDKDLQEVSWDAWFGTFDERDLVFVFQEHMKAGNPSNFFKLDSPGREGE